MTKKNKSKIIFVWMVAIVAIIIGICVFASCNNAPRYTENHEENIAILMELSDAELEQHIEALRLVRVIDKIKTYHCSKVERVKAITPGLTVSENITHIEEQYNAMLEILKEDKTKYEFSYSRVIKTFDEAKPRMMDEERRSMNSLLNNRRKIKQQKPSDT